MARKVSVPAISREIEFIALNWPAVEEVLDRDGEQLSELTNAVWERAQADVYKLFRALEVEMSEVVRGLVRIDWINTDRGANWESWGSVFMPMGPKKRIAYVGFWLGEVPLALRLVGWIRPRYGGVDGRRRLVQQCERKVKGVCLPYDYPKRYPSLTEQHPVVWFDQQLSLTTALNTLAMDLRRASKIFFKAARPLLASSPK
jgi:hypothetical protein